ncbi:VCBS repeat-containing protein [Spirosoma linguale]|uniref:ASPIC/UnbV domain protein n=1 Tax=Spirosoma linguale (strain ATCC 33905 / DSM 74 / LMG 10896 / Claus 1) TaxID=504472 RepID=D2QL93_SPILD|nr:ASPIC/UnbV domain protein [Spirosoma linguale DSM 74]
MKLIRFLAFLPLLAACKGGSSDSVFTLLSASQTHIDFVNSIQETEEDNVLNYEYFYNGGGVAAADFNNDGLIDLYFTANQGEDKLYLNEGKLSFKDITKEAGIDWKGEWKTGVTVVDINKDGWQDMYVSVSANIDKPALRKHKLYINNKTLKNGVPSFTEQAAAYGLDLTTYATQSAFFDYDNDGDLDVYLLNHNVKDFKRFDADAVHAMRDSLAGHRLMRNDGGKFVDVSVQAGIKGNPIGFGLGVHTADLNGDGWLDIYVSNDYVEEDYLYLNNKNGTFTDVVKEATGHVSYFSMGNDVGDINNDLLPDIVTMDMLPEDNKRQKLLFGPDKYEAYLSMLRNGFHPEVMRNMLQLNNGVDRQGRPQFSEIGQLAGIASTDWSWSALLADYDNDGYKDLFITNGYLRDYTNNDFVKYYADQGARKNQSVMEVISHMPSTKTPNYIFRNEHNLTFSNKQTDWGFDTPVISNGAVYADLDNDGDLEIVTNNINEKAHLYQNQTAEKTGNNYVDIVLNPKQAAQSATGTKVYVYSGDLRQFQQYTPTHGFQSSMMIPMHVGLGKAKTIDSLVVVWQNGSVQKLRNVAVNQRLTINYEPGTEASTPILSQPALLFAQTNTLDFQHQQAPLNDFSRQLLLPHMYSYAGPRMVKGDVNKDGLDDIYIGGGKGQSGELFIQQTGGRFEKSAQNAFKQDALCTDTDAAFLDADSDGDLDLYVTSGGYEYLPNDLLLQSRLYLNDGKGNFNKDASRLDLNDYAGNAVEVLDFDKDGDSDLFVCGSVMPNQYPRYQTSRLYRNEKGKFVPVKNDAFNDLGLLTDACVVDFDKDGFDDLVTVGEWTPIIRLRNDHGVFKRVQDELDQTTGFWQRIIGGDFDKDGDIDLIAGNYGLNCHFKASPALPLSMLTDDFDGNGTIDPIVCYYIQGTNYPAYSRDELLDQLAPLRKKYTSYALYSDATADEVVNEFKGKTPARATINELSTLYLVNNKGHFERKELPIQAQFSPVYAMATPDVNEDGFPDLLLAGNQTHGRVRTGNIDANYGQVFVNDRKGGFTYMPQSQSGLFLRGNVRSLLVVNNQLMAGINSEKVQVYTKAK